MDFDFISMVTELDEAILYCTMWQMVEEAAAAKPPSYDGWRYMSKGDIKRACGCNDREYKRLLKEHRLQIERSGNYWRMKNVDCPSKGVNDYLRTRMREDSFASRIFDISTVAEPADKVATRRVPIGPAHTHKKYIP